MWSVVFCSVDQPLKLSAGHRVAEKAAQGLFWPEMETAYYLWLDGIVVAVLLSYVWSLFFYIRNCNTQYHNRHSDVCSSDATMWPDFCSE